MPRAYQRSGEGAFIAYLRRRCYRQRWELKQFMERMAEQKYRTWCVYTIIEGGESDNQDEPA